MKIDARRAYREWAAEAVGPFNAEDAFSAGFELALSLKEEEERSQHPVIKSLEAVQRMLERNPLH